MVSAARSADTQGVNEGIQLRHEIARTLEQRAAAIVADAAAVFPFTGIDTSGPDSHNRLARLLLELLAGAAREGELDPRGQLVAHLTAALEEEHVSVRQLFALVYVLERASLDELALHESFGATSEPWPALAQIVRRSSFDLLGAYAEHVNRNPGHDALTDGLTTLHTRAVLMAATDKEIHRSERFGHPFAIIVVDIDRLSEINGHHGYGAGDRVLERLGILVRNYFREQDWVGRFSGDAFVVLLPETPREHALGLAERVRTTVEGRMALHDYRSEQETPLTVSVGVVFVESVDRSVRAEQLFDEVRQAVYRAKLAGRNRVETVDVSIARADTPLRDLNPLV
jgi:diguanylate cyclase (GGDEF)-like protein